MAVRVDPDVRPGLLDPRIAVPAAIASVLTSPITAIWLLLWAPLVLVGTGVVAATTRASEARHRRLRIGASIGFGLLAGPALYLCLALVTRLA